MDPYTDFGAYSPIQYYDIKKLYWGKYPYKVSVRVPDGKIKFERPKPKRIRALSRPAKREKINVKRRANAAQMLAWIVARQEEVQQFVEARKSTLSDDLRWICKAGSRYKAYHFFFLDEATAQQFVADNQEHVMEVHQPTRQSEVDALKSQVEARTRTELVDALYWAKYRYKVHMKKLNTEDTQSIYDWYEQCFNTEELRNQVWLGGNSRPILYLNTETELVFSMLGIRQYVSHICKAILKEEIEA
jgi:hypothetical protein